MAQTSNEDDETTGLGDEDFADDGDDGDGGGGNADVDVDVEAEVDDDNYVDGDDDDCYCMRAQYTTVGVPHFAHPEPFEQKRGSEGAKRETWQPMWLNYST